MEKFNKDNRDDEDKCNKIPNNLKSAELIDQVKNCELICEVDEICSIPP